MPRDPGLCRKPPDGNSTYARAGGVYPLAAFCDALVDRCLTPATNNGDNGAADSAAAAATAATATEALRIVYDDVMKPGATRHAPGLKCEKAMLMPRNKARSCNTSIIPPSLPLISRLFLSFSLLSFLLDSRS